MRFKLDENLPHELADDLLRLGHDADTVYAEGLIGADDATIVQATQASGRILLTLDLGIANLLRYSIREQAGLVLLRPDANGRRNILSFVRSRLADLLNTDLRGRLTVVTATRIRVRFNPAPGS